MVAAEAVAAQVVVSEAQGRLSTVSWALAEAAVP